MANPNDEVRRKILEYFYDRNHRSTSKQGKKGYQVRISDLKADLKRLHALTQPEVMANLNYLIQKGWVVEERVEKKVTTRFGTEIPSVVEWYYISALGIDEMESKSKYSNEKFTGINITAVGGIVTLGDGNVVNARFEALRENLQMLREAVLSSSDMEDQAKLDVVSDIEALSAQLAKSHPEPTLVKRLFSGIQTAVLGADAVKLAATVAPQVAALF